MMSIGVCYEKCSRQWRAHAGVVMLLLLPLGILIPDSLHAQPYSPSRLVPESARPLEDKPAGGIKAPPTAPAQVPAGAEQLTIRLSGIVIEGGMPELAAATETLRAQLIGKPITVADIFKKAQELEAAYSAAGYLFARVSVPHQQLNDGGSLRLVVVRGHVEAVDVSALPERIRDKVAEHMAPLVGTPIVDLPQLERILLIAGDLAGLQLRSTLMRGTQTGGTRLVLDGEQAALTGSINSDNAPSMALGGWSQSLSVALNSVFRQGEQIYGQISGSLSRLFDDNPRMRTLSAGLVVPIGIDGLTLNPEFTHAQTAPTPALGAPQTRSTLDRAALRVTWPLMRSHALTIRLRGGVEHNDERLALPMFATDIAYDRYLVARAGADLMHEPGDGRRITVSISGSQGLGGRGRLAGALDNVPLSRMGAGPQFTKIAGSASLYQPLWSGFALTRVRTH